MNRLRPEQDAFGRALLAHLENRRAFVVVERDDGFFDSESVEAYFFEPGRWDSVERRALRHVRGRVLDVGLGAGRVALELQRRGHDVTGIDVSPLAVRIARKCGVKKAKVMPFEQADTSLGTFDTVVMFMNNFGLFGSKTKARRLLRRLHRMTSEQGRIVASSNDHYRTKDRAHIAYRRRNLSRGRMAGQLRARLHFRQWSTPWFDYLFASPAELEKLVSGTGWYVRQFIRSEGMSFYVAVIDKEPA